MMHMYFVSFMEKGFDGSSGFGNGQAVLPGPVLDLEHVGLLTSKLEDLGRKPRGALVVLYYQLLRTFDE